MLALLCSPLMASLHPAALAQAGLVGCHPVSERTGETGCWILFHQRVSNIPDGPVYWSLDTFPTRAAAEAAKGSNGEVVESLGKVWVFTIAGKDDRPTGGQHVAQLGPLPVKKDTIYMAQYMESILDPGMQSVTHRHPGAEAFYTEAGETCIETPEGKQVSRKGVNVIVPAGEPMALTATGTVPRRAITLVLHDSSQPWSMVATDWKPKGLCGN